MIIEDFKFLAPQFLSVKNYNADQIANMLKSYMQNFGDVSSADNVYIKKATQALFETVNVN